ncbi:MAG TPA: universal stress protein [Polyangia bacterium]|nr:universal stress protein [Polyangia bacterium]
MAILCATDFSPCSRVAARVAAGLARRRGESVSLVHVVPPPPSDLTAATIPVEAWDVEMMARGRAELEAEAETIRARGVAVDARLEAGIPSKVLLELASAPGTSLLVAGMHGRARIDRVMVGSCAEKLARSAACPVLIVPERTHNLSGWEGGEPLRLALAFDGSSATGALVYWARTGAPADTAGLSLIRLYWPPQEAVHYGVEQPWHENAGSSELLALIERDLKREAAPLFGARDPQVRLQVLVRNGGEELAEAVGAGQVDAVAVGVAHHRFRHWTPIDPKALLRAATVPVFCIPEGIRPAEHHLPHFRSVLIASDLSEVAREAILPAYGLLVGGGRVELCHVHHLGEAAVTGHGGGVPPLSDVERQGLEEKLRALIPPESVEHGIITHVSVAEGVSVATAILQAAERTDAEVIALAFHGRSGLGRLLLGSVAEEVARHSSRPLFLVHAHRGA